MAEQMRSERLYWADSEAYMIVNTDSGKPKRIMGSNRTVTFNIEEALDELSECEDEDLVMLELPCVRAHRFEPHEIKPEGSVTERIASARERKAMSSKFRKVRMWLGLKERLVGMRGGSFAFTEEEWSEFGAQMGFTDQQMAEIKRGRIKEAAEVSDAT